jgi:hypothetical protein
MIPHLTIKELSSYYARRTPRAEHPKRDATVYVDRMVSGASLSQLGRIYKVTPERIRQICAKMKRWENSARGLGHNASDRR